MSGKTRNNLEFTFWLLLTVVVVVICFWSQSRANGQGVAQRAYADIQRRGDSVEYVSGVYSQSLTPPPDDSNQFFISVLASRSCAPCKRLLHDFQSDPALQQYRAWSHFNVFYAEDETQHWRWRQINIKAYPTVLIQPPRNGQYGKPSTVVLQLDGYDGDAERLARTIQAGVVRYIASVNPREQIFPRPFRPRPQPSPVMPSPGPDNVDMPLEPPFDPPPLPEPTPALPQVDVPPPLPELEPVPEDSVLEEEEETDAEPTPEGRDILLDGIKTVLDNSESITLTNLLVIVLLVLAWRQGKSASIKKVVDTYLEAKSEVARANGERRL